MNFDEFVALVDSEAIDNTAFSLFEEKDERYCLSRGADGRFSVFYSEKGHRNDECWFEEQADALAYLWSVVKEDPTTRKAYRHRSLS